MPDDVTLDDIKPGEYAGLMPDMSDTEYETLKRSIRENGYDESDPIVVTPDGIIFDGHHRHRACSELDVEPAIVVEPEPTVEKAYRKNLARRNLDTGTKKQMVVDYLELFWDGDTTQAGVASALGVSQPTVSRAMEIVTDGNDESEGDNFEEYSMNNTESNNAGRGGAKSAVEGGFKSDPERDDADDDESTTPGESAPDDEDGETDGDGQDVSGSSINADSGESTGASDEKTTTIRQLRERGRRLEGMVDERDAILRDVIDAVENKDIDAIHAAADRAEDVIK